MPSYKGDFNRTYSYLLTLDEYRRRIPDEFKPSWVKLTTITMISNFQKPIDMAEMKKQFNLDTENERFQLSRKGNGTDSKFIKSPWAAKIKATTFYNQVTLTYNDLYSTKSIKIFPNGSVQVAGCSDLFDCRRVIKHVGCYLETIFKDKTYIPPMEGYKVVMINSNFSLNYNINLRLVCKEFSKYQDTFKVSFEPDRYSAVKVKFKPAEDMKEITTSIFGTGKIIITGAQTLREIADAYRIINDTINDIPNVRVSPCPQDKIELFDDFNGHKIDKCLKFLKSKGYNSWKYTTINKQINF
jgi:TATA-box binding protein (TBP) (component of TFIID and TFIIIB)